MSVTINDLKVVDSYVEDSDKTEWRHVEVNGERYILTATNVTDDLMSTMLDEDPLMSLWFELGALPRQDNAVFRADGDWSIIGECNDECSKGICTKRIATDTKGDIGTSFDMLIRFLNN